MRRSPEGGAAGTGARAVARPGADSTEDDDGGGRSARKRRAIVDAATALFLAHGYAGTSMDQVAARAAVSKQTVYKNFTDKDRLFADVVLGTTRTAAAFADGIGPVLLEADDVEQALGELARSYLRTVMQPRVLQLRRLLISEAGRFPDLARAYYEQGPERVLAALATAFGQLTDRGGLAVDDPELAADHFAWLVLGLPLDRAMFYEDDVSAVELQRLADAAVRVFLASYGPR